MLPGAAMLNEGAVLMPSIGRSGRAIYAFPTTAGKICYALSGVAAGCAGTLSAETPVDVTVGKPDVERAGVGEPVAVWGLAADGVVSVRVIVAGVPHDAVVSNNSFYYQLNDNSLSADVVQALSVRLADGSTKTITLG
jgi:hypothetical protein